MAIRKKNIEIKRKKLKNRIEKVDVFNKDYLNIIIIKRKD